jgi:hypothetical protein
MSWENLMCPAAATWNTDCEHGIENMMMHLRVIKSPHSRGVVSLDAW